MCMLETMLDDGWIRFDSSRFRICRLVLLIAKGKESYGSKSMDNDDDLPTGSGWLQRSVCDERLIG